MTWYTTFLMLVGVLYLIAAGLALHEGAYRPAGVMVCYGLANAFLAGMR